MNSTERDFRRRSGMAAFERRCRCTMMQGRRVKAYNVPGTQEHGRYMSYWRELMAHMAKYTKQ